jgi:SAM-dependent methyltransferase
MTQVARCLACHGPLEQRAILTGRDLMHGVSGSYAVHQCSTCGSGTTLPLAAGEDLAAYYPASYAPYRVPRGLLAHAMHHVQRARDRRFPLVALRSGRRPGRLLDVGCGRGDLVASWISAGWHALGIEPSPAAAAVARRRGADVLVGTLATVSLERESVDAAVFRHSLEHVLDPQADLRLVHASLRPGGKLAVIVPNWGSWQRRAFAERWFPLELPRHRTHFTAAGLRAALERSGYSDIDVRPATPLTTTVWSVQLRLFGRCLTGEGSRVIAGYAASVPVASIVHAIDRVRGDGDFIHAAATKPG